MPSQHNADYRCSQAASERNRALQKWVSLRSRRPRQVLGERELPIPLGLGATHKEAFFDDLTVPDGIEPDLVEVDTFLALGRDV